MIAVHHRGSTGNIFLQLMRAIRVSKERNMPIKNLWTTYNGAPTGHWNESMYNNFVSFENPIAEPNASIKYKAEYFYQDPKDIKWVLDNTDSILKTRPPLRQGVFVHARLGDIVHAPHYKSSLKGDLEPFRKASKSNKNQSFEYFCKAIEQCSHSRRFNTPGHPEGYISTNPQSVNCILIKALVERYNLKVYTQDVESTIDFGSQFSHKVLSTGTFSLMIGLLGPNSTKILLPNPELYHQWHPDFISFLDAYRHNFQIVNG